MMPPTIGSPSTFGGTLYLEAKVAGAIDFYVRQWLEDPAKLLALRIMPIVVAKIYWPRMDRRSKLHMQQDRGSYQPHSDHGFPAMKR